MTEDTLDAQGKNNKSKALGRIELEVEASVDFVRKNMKEVVGWFRLVASNRSIHFEQL